MIFFQTTIGAVHTLFALLAMISGAYVILTIKGNSLHKKVGYFYFATMLVMNVTGLFTRTLFVFGPFHFLATFSLFTILFGMAGPVFFKHRKNWLYWHFQAMAWSYVGLWAAFASEVIVRLPFVEFGIMFSLMVAVASCCVMVIGGFFIVKYKKSVATKVANKPMH